MTTTIEQPTALATREYTPDLAPRFVLSMDELRHQLRQLEEFKRDIMVEGIDFGVIPGTPKPTLLKPGAEKLSLAFGLAPTFETAGCIEDWEAGFFHYDERCILTSRRTGQTVASANGSANSKEPRYRWRDAKPACLNCGRDLRRSRNRDGDQGEPGWYCWTKTGGCGATFPAAQITGPVGRIENPEPYELVNTIKKMAQKRALVAAILIATGGSGTWTQDVEDMPSVAGETVVIESTARPTPEPARPVASSRNPRQAAVQAPRKPTDTPCAVCGRKVETEALLKDSLKRFERPFCTQHMNEALDRLKTEDDKAEEQPF